MATAARKPDRRNYGEALNSYYEYQNERLAHWGGVYPEIRLIPGFTICAGITDFNEIELEVIPNEKLIAMHQEVKDRLRQGECLHDAWLQAMTVLL